MLSKLLKIFIIILLFVFSGITKAEFSEDFSSVSNISSRQGIYVSTTTQQASLARFENTLLDSDTLLLSHLGTTTDITNPTIGVGGETASTTFSAGYDGNAITITTSSLATLSFPGTGNINARKGAISIWAKSNDWEQYYRIFAADGAGFYVQHDPGRLWFYLYTDKGWVASFINTYGNWSTSTWHNLIFSWDCDAGVISITHDGKNYPYYYAPANPGFSLNNSLVFGSWGSDISFDELRITSKPYNSSYNYTQHDGDNDIGVYLESASFDTGVASPIWGNIEWTSSTPDKTALYIQTNVSANNSAWDGWLNKGMIAFTFDDGYISHYTNARPILGQYGFSGTAYVITDLLRDLGGPSYYLSLSELHEMEDDGWEIGCHGYSHLNISTLTES
ncbi:MAG: polysaccharide deacetylase family protein, partial [Candidatus Falkowbacteria bacterium]|nr:polysaccharide deacetylase family protein [Candidatus Falkowbacteria bacterium]